MLKSIQFSLCSLESLSFFKIILYPIRTPNPTSRVISSKSCSSPVHLDSLFATPHINLHPTRIYQIYTISKILFSLLSVKNEVVTLSDILVSKL